MSENFILWGAGRVLGALNPRRIWRWLKTPAVMIAGGTHFTVLIADLADDVELKQTRHVARILRGQKGIKVLRNGQVLRIGEFGDQAENLVAAEKRGQQWLEQNNADVLVWGEVAGADQVLRLGFLLRTGRIGSDTKGYPLTETLELPTEFHVDFGQVLYITALSAVEPATEMEGQYLVDLLRPAARKVERLLDQPPPGLPPETLAHIHAAYGNAVAVLGEQSGDFVWLARAEKSFRAALEFYTRDRLPLSWAMTQNNLGCVFQALGEREEGTVRLEEAVTAFRAALEVRTRDRAPLQWAATQNNLGNALLRLGQRERGMARLEEAVTAFRAALEVYTRNRLPLDWAMTQNNLGSALLNLGKQEERTGRLEEAVTAYRAALEVYTPVRAPLGWAKTQNNLGNALAALGERQEGTARLEEAVTAFRAALEVRTRDRLPLQWAMTQNNLAGALTAMGEREEGTARLKEAITAYEGALEVFEAAEGADYYVSGTKENLALAQKILAERRES